MTTPKRNPGRVDEEARPINAPGPQEGSQQFKTADQTTTRIPGRVTEQTESVNVVSGSGT